MRSLFQPTFPFHPARIPFFYGWWILGVSSLGIVASIPGQTMGFSVFTPILSEVLGLSLSAISTAYLIGTVVAGHLVGYGMGPHDRSCGRGLAVFSGQSGVV